MITIQGKQMLFPNEEQTFVLGDNGTTSRTFRLSRYEADRTDLAGLTFRLDLEYKTGEKNTALLTKEVREESILLLWNVTKADIRTDGTMFLSIRAFDETGEVRWNTARTPIFGENAIDTPGSYEGSLSELEQMEQKISHVLDSESKREAAEAERKTKEGERETAETARQAAEEQRKKDMAAALEAAAKATEQALNAEGPPGPAGPKGETGATGEMGPAGPTGPRGETGAQGPAGPRGETGATGPTGPKGERGEVGSQGERGEGFQVLGSYETLEELWQGVTEPKPGMAYAVGAAAPYDIYIYDRTKGDWTNHGKLQGPEGPAGKDGANGQDGQTGPAGPPGKDGAQGPAGPPGKDGAQGPEGPAGKDGAQGPAGPAGKDGTEGPEGPPGKDGVAGQDGRPGANGKSAYETAKEAGYQGTEAELAKALTDCPKHQQNRENPHGVTAEQAGALPLSGGTLTGELSIENNGGQIDTHTSSIMGQIAIATEGKYRSLDIVSYKHETNNAYGIQFSGFDGKDGRSWFLFGQHNKPIGQYIGDGSTTERIIETGGIGNVIIIRASGSRGKDFVTLVSGSMGGFGKDATGAVVSFYNDTATFKEGVLRMTTAEAYLNQAGKNYYYQVL